MLQRYQEIFRLGEGLQKVVEQSLRTVGRGTMGKILSTTNEDGEEIFSKVEKDAIQRLLA